MVRARRHRFLARCDSEHLGDNLVEDALTTGTTLRILTIMDACTRAGQALDVALTTSAERVIGVLTAVVAPHGPPAYLRSDHGAACVAPAVQR